MSTIELPINDKVPIKTYNHHAFGLGILMNEEKANKWLYDNYILLSYYGENKFYTFDFYMDYIYCQPVFEREHIDDDIIAMGKINRMKYIISALKSERYVIMCVNELFIPNTLAFANYNFWHNILIYGYDERRKIFKIMGYNNEQKSSTWSVRYDDIRKATPNKITLLRARKNYEFQVHIEYILKQIGIFLKYKELEPVGCYPSKMRYVGVDACKKLQEDVTEKISNLEEIDIRPFSLLKEYAALMSDRMRCLSEMGMNVSISTFNNITNMFEALMNRVMIYNIKTSERNGGKVADLLEKAIQELINALSEVYNNR